MKSEWPIEPLGVHCSKIGSGATPRGGKSSYLEAGKFALIRSQNVYNDGFHPDGLAFISENQAEALSNVTVDAGDILLNITGDSVARVCLVPRAVLPARVNQHVSIIRPKKSSFDSRFLRYFLASPMQQQVLLSLAAIGATRNALTKGLIESLEVPIPPIAFQKQCADILSSLDDRIDNLRATNATLEAIAQALFKSWFVDFDPVHAKAEGRTPAGMDAATAALFPGEFEDSELGLIPEGWRVTRLVNLCSKVQNGGTPSRANNAFWQDGTVPWFKTGELSDGFLIEPSEFITKAAIKQSSAKLLPRHAVLMAIYAAPTVGRFGVLSQESAFNQACTGMIARDDVGPWFLLQTLRDGRDWYNNRANGAAQQNISKAIVGNLPCIEPPAAIRHAFTNVAEPVYGLVEQNARRIGTLSSLRDTLVPRLISGKLRLPEAAEAVETALV